MIPVLSRKTLIIFFLNNFYSRTKKQLKLWGLDLPYLIILNYFAAKRPDGLTRRRQKHSKKPYKFENLIIQESIVSEFLLHNFDILGSGLVNVNRKSGNNSQNSKIHQAIIHSGRYYKYKKLLPPSYVEIDWQKDYKSGFRWKIERSGGVQYLLSKNKLGVDIKIPWELGRLQHLPFLALGVCCAKKKNKKVTDEIHNQLVDFVVNNPIGFGVQWACTMDVAIRVANIVLTKTILDSRFLLNPQDLGALDSEFIDDVIYDHGRFITRNLEWSEKRNGNHYLTNIAGLLYAANYINCAEADEWLLFAINEILRESELQFYPDGINFEGSTSYHCLTTEVLLFSFAQICGITADRESRYQRANFRNYTKSKSLVCTVKGVSINQIKERLAKKLYDALKFVEAITRPDDEIAQIGDNDSGRFFKLGFTGDFLSQPSYIKKYKTIISDLIEKRGEYFDEINLNHTHLNAGLVVFFGERKKILSNNNKAVLLLLSRNCEKFSVQNAYDSTPRLNKARFRSPIQNKNIREQVFKSKKNLLEDLTIKIFQPSGYIVASSKYLYLIIVFSNIPDGDSGGHHHNDKLSFDLWIDGKDIYRDPGSAIYTADIDKRNVYRSVKFHNTISTNAGEQNNFPLDVNGLFSMDPPGSKAHCCYINNHEIGLECNYKNIIHQRKIVIGCDQVVVTDYCNFKMSSQILNLSFSPGYGKILN
jgi:hypothetical protein